MKKSLLMMTTIFALTACGGQKTQLETPAVADFDYVVDRFADMQILRYRVPDIEKLTLRQQEMLYYLTEAALQGRDIMYDQNCKYNLPVRQILEAIYTDENQDTTSADFKALTTYLKRVWVSNGIHHHYAGDKFTPEFSQGIFRPSGAQSARRKTAVERWHCR